MNRLALLLCIAATAVAALVYGPEGFDQIPAMTCYWAPPPAPIADPIRRDPAGTAGGEGPTFTSMIRDIVPSPTLPAPPADASTRVPVTIDKPAFTMSNAPGVPAALGTLALPPQP